MVPAMLRLPSRSLPAAVLLVASLTTSCAVLNLQGGQPLTITPPTITFSGATLVASPASKALGAFYCPELVSVPFGGAQFLCGQLFGPRPDVAALSVVFDLHFHVANPNQVPLPLASVLAAATVFPSTSNEKLGAACMSLCPGDAPGCTGAAAAGACESSSRDVRSLNDFVQGALPQLLIANGVALAGGGSPTFTLPPLVAASEVDVTVRYGFGPDQLLGIMRQLASQSVGELKRGTLPTFAIPYRLEGTIWFDAGSIGRIAVGWGPSAGTFTLPVEGLIGG